MKMIRKKKGITAISLSEDNPLAQDEVLTVEKVAEMLGVTKWAILKRIERKKMKPIKDGKRYYFLKSDLIRYMRVKKALQR